MLHVLYSCCQLPRTAVCHLSATVAVAAAAALAEASLTTVLRAAPLAVGGYFVVAGAALAGNFGGVAAVPVAESAFPGLVAAEVVRALLPLAACEVLDARAVLAAVATVQAAEAALPAIAALVVGAQLVGPTLGADLACAALAAGSSAAVGAAEATEAAGAAAEVVWALRVVHVLAALRGAWHFPHVGGRFSNGLSCRSKGQRQRQEDHLLRHGQLIICLDV